MVAHVDYIDGVHHCLNFCQSSNEAAGPAARRGDESRCMSQPSRAGQQYKPFVWRIVVSSIFSLLLPMKSALLGVLQSRLRLTQELQYLLKKERKKEKKDHVSVFPQSACSLHLIGTLCLVTKKKKYIPARQRVT